MSTQEYLHIKSAIRDGCDIHEWPTDGLADRLVQSMRELHGKGGVNACRDCCERAWTDAKSKRGMRSGVPDGSAGTVAEVREVEENP